ncbi:hypothetical protein QWY92_09325 [Algibacter miyuki]|nr:hypothetical protein [Algibacter miyuki]MDN3665613.1 hypothetical protein [Algibacter miyuki]
MATSLMVFLNLKELPIADGKVSFSEEQTEKLKAELSEEVLLQAIEAFNKDIAENSKVEGISNEIKQMLAAMETPEEAAANKAKEKNPDATEETPNVDAQLVALKAKMKERDETIKALLAEAESDTPLERILNTQAKEMIKHSATHLFASGKDFDAFDGRNWNKLAAGQSVGATDWTASDGANIQKLNGDAELYFREDPKFIKSLHRDNFGLPSAWGKTFNVVDKITTGSITTAEITQGRKLPWLPKNKQSIQAEEGKIFPISIDIEYAGHLLSQIEASWLASFNMEGSQYDKMTFVRFLLTELDKKARLEDRIASIKGVYVETPDDATKAGSYLNRQDGLLVQLWRARDVRKIYRAFKLGTPTSANIADYIHNLITSLPYEVRTANGLELGLSPSHLTSYKNRIENLHGTQNDYKGKPTFPRDYPNIKFQEVLDFEGTDFMYITETENLDILENRPKEKNWYRFGFDGKRNIFIVNDYKLGIRMKHIGNKVKDGDPAEFKVQSVWSNDVPLFNADFFAPIYDDKSGEITATFNQLKVDENWATDITKISGLAEGVILKIQGDTALASSKYVKDNSDLDLASDFDLSNGGTLSLIVLADGTLKELARTAEPASTAEESVVSYDTATLDAADGSEFTYTGTAALTITEILNGVQGQKVKVYGNAAASQDVTINTIGNIKVASAAVLKLATDSIEFVLLDGVWTEFNRDITV